MDDIRMVRELYGEVAPDPQLERRIRARLTGPPRRRRLTPGRTAAGLVAVAAAAALGISTLGGGSGGSGGSIGDPRSAPPSPLSARMILLAAAEKAEQQPIGKYWYTDQVSGQSYIIGAKTGPYAITGAHLESFAWAGTKKGGGAEFYERDLPARPLTEADEARWRKAGSPSSFRVWSSDHYWTYQAKASNWKIDERDPGGGGTFFMMSTPKGTARHLDVEELQNLPADPGELAKIVFSPRMMPPKMRLARRAQGGGGQYSPQMAIMQVSNLLERAPIPPKVRAGLMRALAARPGIQAIGTTTDPLGRPGVALAADAGTTRITAEDGGPPEAQGEYGSRSEIIFDAKTGKLLAKRSVLTKPGGPYRTQQPGFVIDYWATRDYGWTNDKPKPPAKLPF